MSFAGEYLMPLLLRPSAIRRPAHGPGTMVDMDMNDIMFSCLRDEGHEDDLPIVSALPTSQAKVLNLAQQLMDAGMDALEDLLKDIKVWRKPSQVLLSLPGVVASRVALSSLLTRMFEAYAVPGADFGIGPTTQELDIVEVMIAKNFAEETVPVLIFVFVRSDLLLHPGLLIAVFPIRKPILILLYTCYPANAAPM